MMIRNRSRDTGTITALTGALLIGLSTVGLTADSPKALWQYTSVAWTATNGLPSESIWAINQDRDGYLWLGTDSGLIRFDGVRFVTWDELGRPPLPTNRIRALLASKSGDLWIGFGGSGGIGRFQDGVLTNYSPRDGVPVHPIVLLDDYEGTVWTGGLGGLSRFRDGRWERIVTSPGLAEDTVATLYEDRQSTLWASTTTGVILRPRDRPAFERLPSLRVREMAIDLRSVDIRSIAEDSAGTIWVAGPTGIRSVSASPPNRTLNRLARANGSQLLRDRRGNLWAGTLGQGLFRVGHGSLTVEQRSGHRLTSDFVRCLFEDREGNIWVGTQRGLNRFSKNSLVTMPLPAQSEVLRAVTVGADGSIWTGTEHGVYRFSGTAYTRYDKRSGLPNSVVGALHTDRQGTVWMATNGGHVGHFVKHSFVPIRIPRSAKLDLIRAITVDFEGAIWLCDSANGLFRWKDGALQSFDDLPDIPNRVGTAAFTDSRGGVWIGFADGTLGAFSHDSFRSFSQVDGLPGGSIDTIIEDSHGRIWVGTENGLSRFDGRTFVSLLGRYGLPSHSVRSIVEDGGGDLWLGVSTGIIRINASEFDQSSAADPHRPVYTFYDVSDGLQGSPMSGRGYPSATRAGDGTLWFITTGGFSVIDSRRSQRRPVAPPVKIEYLIADGQIHNATSPLRLAPLTSRVQIDYTGLSFAAARRLRFRYRLEGLDNDWVDAGTRRQAYYTNLEPHRYRFRVIAGNDDAWNEAGATLDFSIQPTFYQTRWFDAAVCIAIALCAVAAWRSRLHQVHKRLSLVFAERARVGREIHDTLLQSLTGVGFQLHTLSEEVPTSPESAVSRLHRLRRQIDSCIRETRGAIADLRSPSLGRRDLAAALRELGRRTVRDRTRFELSTSGMPRHQAPRLEEHLLRIAQEAISNAVHHAHATIVRVELNHNGETVILRVIDDGCGFQCPDGDADAGGHWGLTIMRERARLIGGRFAVVSTLGQGTEVTVTASFWDRRVEV